MKSKILFPFLVLLASINLQAQYIELQSGFAFASGNFSNSNLSKSESGFAKSGTIQGLSLAYLITEKVGICGKINYSQYGFNTADFSEQNNETAFPGITLSVATSEKFKASSALTGVYVSLGKNNFTVDLKLLVGFMQLATPRLEYISTFNGTTNIRIVESNNDGAAAIGYGISAKYAFPKNIYLTINLDNLNATMRYPSNGLTTSNIIESEKPFQAYWLTLGLGYAIQ